MAAKRPSKKAPKPSKKSTTSGRPNSVSRSSGSQSPVGPTSGRKATRPSTLSAASAGEDARVAQIRAVIEVMVQAGAVEVEMRDASSKLRVRLKEDPPMTYVASPVPGLAAPTPAVGVHAAPVVAAAPAAAAAEPQGEAFQSPMIGSFYRAASPDAEPFVSVGDRVEADTTLCIIEAMKVMNEIKAEMSGEVVAVLVQNGEPVEYGQPLFRIRV